MSKNRWNKQMDIKNKKCIASTLPEQKDLIGHKCGKELTMQTAHEQYLLSCRP